jgi:hypothetical protein
MVFEDVVPGTADEEFVAVGAIRVGSVGVDVAFVDEVEADFAGDEEFREEWAVCPGA